MTKFEHLNLILIAYAARVELLMESIFLCY